MPDHEAPRVFVSYAHDSPEHRDQVHSFAAFLRADIGLDVRLDLWDDNVRRDWSLWAIEQLTEADFVLIVASPAYKRRADGTAPPTEGWGSQFEASIIRDNLTRNLRRETERILPVILPGNTIEEIPTFLNGHSTTWYEIPRFTREGVRDLLTAITGQGQYPMPERGTWLAAPDGPALVARDVRWLSSSADVRAESAWIGGVRYDNSIVLRSIPDAVGFVEVDLGGRYERMKSTVGVLDDAKEPFQVGHFRVWVDGKPQPEHKASFGKPATIEVDIAGARTLRLEMYRPNTTASPPSGGWQATGGPPELAWANPKLFR